MDRVLLCKPNIYALKLANTDTDTFLFRQTVDIDRVLFQFNNLKSILNKNNIEYIDIFELLPDNISYEYYTNLIFVRDLFINTGNGIIIGNMKNIVRSFETKLIEQILNKLNITPIYRCIDNEILEGGDYIRHLDTTFIAIGTRSNMKAVNSLLNKDLFGTDKVVIIYSDKDDKDMHRIHLDCYFAVYGYKCCLLWEELIRNNSEYNRLVIEYKKDEDGEYVNGSINKRLYEYLINEGYYVTPLSSESQKKYGCNIVELPNGKILVQDEESYIKVKGSIKVEFDEIHNMYGGIHCATNII